MRHRYECPLRWADMDQLRHVNNVRYADYLQEARIDFFRTLSLRVSDTDLSIHGVAGSTSGEDSEEAYGIVVVRHEMTYLAPLRFDFRPVSIEVWVSEVRAATFTVDYEIFRDGGPGEPRTVYLRARTRLAPYVFGSERPRRLTGTERSALEEYVEPGPDRVRAPRPPAVRRTRVGHYPVTVRFSDLDPYGHVNNVVYLEYFQEARILLNGRLWRDAPKDVPHVGLVVAQADVDYLRPLLGRAEGYDLWTWVERLGTRSATMASEIRDGDTVMARASVVVVFFDPGSERSIEPPPAYADPLRAALAMPDDPGAVARAR